MAAKLANFCCHSQQVSYLSGKKGRSSAKKAQLAIGDIFTTMYVAILNHQTTK
jgi:hypothetical protein